MLNDRNPHWVYTQTIKMFAAPASPPFEDEAELERHWGRVWGIDNDVGQIRSVLVHRPGPEMAVVDPAKRIPEIGSFGDVDKGWYFQSETPPDVPTMQAEHDALVAALKAAGIEVFHAEGVEGGRLKSCYTRDPLIMVKGGADRLPHGRAHPSRRGAGDHSHPRQNRHPNPAHHFGHGHNGGRKLRLDQQQYGCHRRRRACQPRRRTPGRRGPEAAGRRAPDRRAHGLRHPSRRVVPDGRPGSGFGEPVRPAPFLHGGAEGAWRPPHRDRTGRRSLDQQLARDRARPRS